MRCWKRESKGPLPRSSSRLRNSARFLSPGFARVGIIAVVDEPTGNQADRARDALAEILGEFVAKELRKWVRTFPGEIYREMFRLRNMQYTQTPRAERQNQIAMLLWRSLGGS